MNKPTSRRAAMNRALAENFMRVHFFSNIQIFCYFHQSNMDDKIIKKQLKQIGCAVTDRGKLSVFRLILSAMCYVYTLFYFISFILYFGLFPCNNKKSAEVCH